LRRPLRVRVHARSLGGRRWVFRCLPLLTRDPIRPAYAFDLFFLVVGLGLIGAVLYAWHHQRMACEFVLKADQEALDRYEESRTP